jgi:hypothetical protein
MEKWRLEQWRSTYAGRLGAQEVMGAQEVLYYKTKDSDDSEPQRLGRLRTTKKVIDGKIEDIPGQGKPWWRVTLHCVVVSNLATIKDECVQY